MEILTRRKTTSERPTTTVAETVEPLVHAFVGEQPPVVIEFWDGSRVGRSSAVGSILIKRPEALRRVVWAPGELGLGRAYVAGDIQIDGDLNGILMALKNVAPPNRRMTPTMVRDLTIAARKLELIGAPPPPPPIEAQLSGRLHSRQRDSASIAHHYDVGNDFYRLVLGPTMTYSCARFTAESASLEEAQIAKVDLVCRKLGLHERPGMSLIDIGCGWGTMALHAAQTYGARVVGITLSTEQAKEARKRIAEAGLGDRVEIRIQDYRDVGTADFDAVSSIGMSEHVGMAKLTEYFTCLRKMLRPGGRMLNHAISSKGGSKLGPRSFMARYVFPDGELIDVADVARTIQHAGFEVRDVESLREHYALTLRRWIANLDTNWEQACGFATPEHARVWKLYMTGCAIGFEDGGLSLHQVLGAVTDHDGASSMPLTRTSWN
jgi:cyclopropane-fatty-acyl-phospholipid synthase